jgi:hypothetical protein
MAGHGMLCVLCGTREGDAFESIDVLLCIECSAHHEPCAECAEPYDFTLTGLHGACDACLTAAQRDTRLLHAA